jgi:non-specific protein-tyrosine kinase
MPEGKRSMVEILKAFQKVPPKDNEPDQNADEQAGVNVSTSGWVSPQYTDSARVELDWNLVEHNRCVGLLSNAPVSDHYKMLRTQINRQMQANGWRTLMVTSLYSGEGKTITAINLAAVFAKEFQRTVLLVDADLSQQRIHHYLGFESQKGLLDYLLDDCPMAEIVVWPQVEKLAIISGGQRLQKGGEVINSPKMQALIHEMKNRYSDRYVIFDVPALLEAPDALAFAAFVDAVLIVVAKGRTPMPDVQRVMGLLPREKIAGFVMNRDA